MSVKERLIQFIKFKGISIRSFCRLIDVSSGFVTSIRKSIQPDKLLVIAERFPELNTEWLITGNGEMIRDSYMMPGIARDTIVAQGVEVFKDKLIEMFKNGEIFSKTVVTEKDRAIQTLYQDVMRLESENKKLTAEIEQLRERLSKYDDNVK